MFQKVFAATFGLYSQPLAADRGLTYWQGYPRRSGESSISRILAV